MECSSSCDRASNSANFFHSILVMPILSKKGMAGRVPSYSQYSFQTQVPFAHYSSATLVFSKFPERIVLHPSQRFAYAVPHWK